MSVKLTRKPNLLRKRLLSVAVAVLSAIVIGALTSFNPLNYLLALVLVFTGLESQRSGDTKFSVTLIGLVVLILGWLIIQFAGPSWENQQTILTIGMFTSFALLWLNEGVLTSLMNEVFVYSDLSGVDPVTAEAIKKARALQAAAYQAEQQRRTAAREKQEAEGRYHVGRYP